jgi:hypothetical protein
MTMIRLSRRQAKEADRVSGIELLILWPDSLGPEPSLPEGHEREATPPEKAEAERLVRASCEQHRLVPVHTRVACVRRPPGLPAAHELRAHLAVTIIGYRWVHASTRSRGLLMFAGPPDG